ncbi:hypothetical protein D1007_47765 [Hordeum vulgare]|nr:hypothetical protein D1007_47765 [Hordeum vulgare]
MRVKAVETAAAKKWEDDKVVHNGAKLGDILRDEAVAGRQSEQTWKLLVDVWARASKQQQHGQPHGQASGHGHSRSSGQPRARRGSS